MTAPSAVHPLLPRFAQAITGALCLEALVFQQPAGVWVALVLVLLGLAGPRVSPVAWVVRRIAPPPASLEPAAPVRFSQGLAAVALAAATVLLAAGVETVGSIVAGLVAAMALFSAVSGICLGCEAYRLVFLRRSRTPDVRADLGLCGDGPWLVVLTAPGCARCEPVARRLEKAAGGRAVVRVSIAERPRAGALPVRSVPAALAVDAGGAVRRVLAGRLEERDLEELLAAI